jgi:hypothetical protein
MIGDLSHEITDAEAAVGFALTDGHVVLTLGHGLFAVKIKHAGEVRYAICDDAMNLLYPTAGSLDELAARFDVKAQRTG